MMMSSERVSSFTTSSFFSWKYDVFLSFRGEDTRRNFTDHLYAALIRAGITVFRDDNELERGKAISSGLFKAIQESRISIIVFSRNYAHSTWCLDELVHIVECKDASDHQQQIVFPIFYDVEPTVVRKQTGSFHEAFSKHEQVFSENLEKVQKWRHALKEVANISGWEPKYRNESEFIEDIVKEISNKIPTKPENLEELVGIESHLKNLRDFMNGGSNDVRMVGICGMGGIGKTTLARVVYYLFSAEYDGSCFLANVREISGKGGLISLQRQLLSQLLKLDENTVCNVYDGTSMIRSRLRWKKVFLVVDDVDDVEQLECLAGKHDWFGPDSRIIITSRNEHLLRSHGVDQVYKVKELNDDNAHKFFRMKAFKTQLPLNEDEELTKLVVKYASGLPLALKVLGSFLYGRPADEWRSALERLKRDAEKGILDKLQISFDGLRETEKEIFLDIACFFKWKNKDYVTRILDGCGFEPVIGIKVLLEKSLITITECNYLWMHDLLQEMGQQIVKRESFKEPGKRSRLWKGEDIFHVLTTDTATNTVEGIILNDPEDKVHTSIGFKAFSRMTNLRVLKISKVQLLKGLEYLPNELRLLEWQGYPLKSLPSNSQLDKTIELDMSYSSIEQFWNGIKPLSKLKFMKLSHSQNLIRTPDFTGVPNLEELILDECTSLCEIHPSLLLHKKLRLLSLEGCSSLKALPSKIAMESLESLVLSHCLKLKIFPEIIGRMDSLTKLYLDGTAIRELPSSVILLTGLALLNLKDCNNLASVPSCIYESKSLKTLNLSGCSKLENASENLGKAENLEELDLSGTAIIRPESSIFLMKNLKALSFRGCRNQRSPKSWYQRFPAILMSKRISDPMPLILPHLSGLSSLTKLDLSDCNLTEEAIPSDICSLSSLETLNLSGNKIELLPGTITCLPKLTSLYLQNCKGLKSLSELPSSVGSVSVDGCASLETLSGTLEACVSRRRWISCLDCLKLVNKSDLVLSNMLKQYVEFSLSYVEERSNPEGLLSLIVPGRKIPEWFNHQTEGSSINIRKHLDSDDTYKLVGFAFCCAFHINKNLPVVRHQHYDPRYLLECDLRTDNMIPIQGISMVDEVISSKVVSDKKAMSDHLWLLYFPYHGGNRQPKYHQFSVKYQRRASPGVEVKSCGVHFVYTYEKETFNKTTNQWSRSIVYTLNESHHSSVEAKRSLTDHFTGEASGSNGCCDDDEEPPAKRCRKAD